MIAITMVACEKESHILTMDEAREKAEKIIKKYPNRTWYISESILEPRTVIHYCSFGFVPKEDSERVLHEYVTPDYRAWLVMLSEDASGPYLDTRCLHVFVNAETGKCEEVWLDGQAIVEWGDDAISRWMGI